jgi:CheY-like chemotaxis protein
VIPAVKKRILLVEDHTDTADVLKSQLAFLGYETTIAKNGLEAVDLAGSENSDLIVMDIKCQKWMDSRR